jgi:arylsulfatase A-like enzyme
MKTAHFLLRFATCAIAGMPFQTTASAISPNILLIYSDDHGWADIGLQGSDPDVRTPNMDQLARDGVVFKRGYTTAPQCVPSRAGLLTGRYQQKFGVEDNLKGPLPLAEQTIAERLRAAGYVTGQVGKWHLDLKYEAAGKKNVRVDPAHFPHEQGFDEYWRGELRQFYASHDLEGNAFPNAPRLVVDDRFRVVVQTDAAISFLNRRAAKPEQPWFMYLAWYAPHVPLDSPEPWYSRTPAHLPKERRQALSMIAAMDDGLGRIRSKLREMGQEQKTLVFFISDNGAPLGGAWNGSLNVPMRGQKGMLSEGGIRVPFVCAWPGTIPPGQIYEYPVITLDVAATAMAVAVRAKDPALDGMNLMPYITGVEKTAPTRTLYWRWGSQAAVLEYPNKLITLGDRERLLFDVTRPEGENRDRNLAQHRPEVAARLEQKLRLWSEKLRPAGLPTSLDKHHETLFAEHEISSTGSHQQSAGASAQAAAPDGAIQGWLCRNGRLSISGESPASTALSVTAEPGTAPNARMFLTNSTLELPPPIEVTLTVRSAEGGSGSLNWRTKSRSFTAEQAALLEWSASQEWHKLSATIQDIEPVIHLRIHPPKTCEKFEVQSIELRGKNGKAQSWRFHATPR